MKQQLSRPLLGAHVSAAGGLLNVIKNGEAIGAECVQIFATSPRQWDVKLPKEFEIAPYRTALKESSVKKVFIHAPYLINLASPDAEIYKKSLNNLMGNVNISEMIGAEGVIFHLGSAKDSDKTTAFQKQVDALKYVVKNHTGKTKIILENSAGGGNKFGASIEDIAMIIKAVGSKRLAVCFDTAHAFEAGIISSYTQDTLRTFLNSFDKLIGIDRLVAMHINDSKTEFASNHDQHENIGKGLIGMEAFVNLAREKRLVGTSWLLETPGDGSGPRKEDVELLKGLF